MNKEEIINNSVKHCCICDNKKYGEFISINDEKYHLCCIEQLQQENKQLKEIIDKVIKLIESDYFEDGSFENEYEVMNLLKEGNNE